MRKTKLKKQSKQSISKIQRELWELCKKIIRKKYGNTCYTCEATNLSGSNWHTGHLFAKASLGAFLKYDLRVLRPQCYKCNIHHGGQGAIFIEKMRKVEGNDYVDKILADRQKTVKAYDFYCELLEEYKTYDK
jgi:hypothetical protein